MTTFYVGDYATAAFYDAFLLLLKFKWLTVCCVPHRSKCENELGFWIKHKM